MGPVHVQFMQGETKIKSRKNRLFQGLVAAFGLIGMLAAATPARAEVPPAKIDPKKLEAATKFACQLVAVAAGAATKGEVEAKIPSGSVRPGVRTGAGGAAGFVVAAAGLKGATPSPPNPASSSRLGCPGCCIRGRNPGSIRRRLLRRQHLHATRRERDVVVLLIPPTVD